jgi:hypothetical protein
MAPKTLGAAFLITAARAHLMQIFGVRARREFQLVSAAARALDIWRNVLAIKPSSSPQLCIINNWTSLTRGQDENIGHAQNSSFL